MSREDELVTRQKDVCKGLGLPLTPPKSHGWKTEQAGVVGACGLCGSASWEDFADGVTAVAAGDLAKFEAVAKKRKSSTIDLDVKDWFLDYHEHMKVKHKWNMLQFWRRAQEMLPSLLKDVHEATLYRWTHSECVKKNEAGRELVVQQLCRSGGSDFRYVSQDLRC